MEAPKCHSRSGLCVSLSWRRAWEQWTLQWTAEVMGALVFSLLSSHSCFWAGAWKLPWGVSLSPS